ncbi:unnamed protein product, partial [Aphanomyces euteiches]
AAPGKQFQTRGSAGFTSTELVVSLTDAISRSTPGDSVPSMAANERAKYQDVKQSAVSAIDATHTESLKMKKSPRPPGKAKR